MTKKITIKNKRGLLLSTIIEKPTGNGPFPTILFLHGFKGYKEEETYTDLAQKCLEKEIASIRFDASGFGDSEGTLEEDYRFSHYIDDTEVVYRWSREQKFVDKEHFGVIGQSMGGAQAIVFASNHPEIQFAVAISPPDRIGTKDILGAIKNQWKKDGYLEEMSSRYGKKIKVLYAYLEDAMQYDFSEFARKIQVPLLIVLGEEDTVVLPEQTLRVFEYANEPKTLMRFAHMNHFYKRDPEILEEVDQKIIEYVMKML